MSGGGYGGGMQKSSPYQTGFGGGYTQPNPGFGSDPMAAMPGRQPQTGGMSPPPQQPQYQNAFAMPGKIGYQQPQMQTMQPQMQPSAASPAVGNVRDPVTGEWSMAKGGQQTPSQGGAYGNYGSQPWMTNLPGWAQNNNPYGARADIGSPGWQSTLRGYAMQRGQDPNSMMGGLTPLWNNQTQPWEQTMTREQGQLADSGSLMSLLRNFRSGY